jgi:citrate lyase subunit beta/citryl-CoA lyase
MTRPPRSYLYVPGDRPSMFAKAVGSGADVVVLDLEDAVAADNKRAALANVLAFLAERPETALQVRVPGVNEPLGGEMLRALAGADGLALIRLAKTDTADDMRAAAMILDQFEAPPTLKLGALLESARGVENAFEIATAGPRVGMLSLGEADLRADLNLTDDRGLLYARGRTVNAARAAGLPAPSQSVYTDVGDLDGLRATCIEGRALGFQGRSVVHPRQIPIVNEEYGLTASELDHIRALAAQADRVAREGAFLLDDGRLADAATIAQARALLGDDA